MSQHNSSFEAKLLLYFSALLVGGAAIYRGGNRWLALTLMEWVSIALLALMLWMLQTHRHTRGRHGSLKGQGRTWALAAIMTSPLWVAAVQVLPLPKSWADGATRAPLLADVGAMQSLATFSVLPVETLQAALAAMPVVCCFALALYVSSSNVQMLLRVWVISAVVQAVFGLLQLVMPELGFSELPIQESQGSFGSRNSFANYLAMLLPVVLLWTMKGSDQGQGDTRRNRLFWASALLLFLAALIASSSRGGIATGFLALMLAWALLSEPRSSSSSSRGWGRWLASLAPLLLLMFAMASGGWDWLKRYEDGDPSRLLSWAATWQAAQTFWPVGSGLGTFAFVFPSFQPPELGIWFVNFAHNDYLQLLMEAGALALPVFALLLGLVLMRCFGVARARLNGPWSRQDAVAVACGLGFLAQLLHAWVDYPWRIPATAMLGAFLLGVFLRSPPNSHK